MKHDSKQNSPSSKPTGDTSSFFHDLLYQKHAAHRHSIFIAPNNTNLLEMSETFRTLVHKDRHEILFNNSFAESIFARCREFEKNLNRLSYLNNMFIILLFCLLIGYNIPSFIPYIHAERLYGAIDISVLVLLYLEPKMYENIAKRLICKTMLIVYCQENYDLEERRFVLFQWGVDDLLVNDINAWDYGNLSLKKW